MTSRLKASLEAIADPVDKVRCCQCESCLDVSGRRFFESVACEACGNVIVVPAALGAYYLYGILGQGGMGCVYDAWDPDLERMVALKVLLCSAEGLSARQTADFEQESRAAAGICHPHIARVYDFGYYRQLPYLVMERVEGGRFDAMIRKLGALEPGFVLRTSLDVADGLALADASGLLHGDIKPENILFDTDMQTKLVDFGLATFVGDSGGERIRGTPYYIAPERLQRRPLDARADIYSLGATLYHALSGRTPFVGESVQDIAMARLSCRPDPLRDLRPDVPLPLERVVMRMLEADPMRRYPNYRSLMADLREVQSRLTNAVEPAVAGRPPDVGGPVNLPPATRNWRRVASITICVLLALGLLLAAYWLAFQVARGRVAPG